MNQQELFEHIIKNPQLTFDFAETRKRIQFAVDESKSSVSFEDAVLQVKNNLG
jgi:hypothetical protein